MVVECFLHEFSHIGDSSLHFIYRLNNVVSKQRLVRIAKLTLRVQLQFVDFSSRDTCEFALCLGSCVVRTQSQG